MYKKSRSQLYGYPSISMRVRRSLSINSNPMANRPACWYVAENIGSLENTREYGSTGGIGMFLSDLTSLAVTPKLSGYQDIRGIRKGMEVCCYDQVGHG